ncbi:MAG: hypothetical protein JXA60_10210 [Candidatus Coatesbacteria bacterium]|nr:hypothetical protein [Candidatus Coatesbacteria bacterium]
MKYKIILVFIFLFFISCARKTTDEDSVKKTEQTEEKKQTEPEKNGNHLWKTCKDSLSVTPLDGFMKTKDGKVEKFSGKWTSIRRYGRALRIEFSNKAPANPDTPIVTANNAFHIILGQVKPDEVFKKTFEDTVDEALYDSYYHINQKNNVSYEIPHGDWSLTLKIGKIESAAVEGELNLQIKSKDNKEVVGELKGYFKALAYPKDLLVTK